MYIVDCCLFSLDLVRGVELSIRTHLYYSHILPCLSFSSRWYSSARKGPYTLRPVSQQSPQGCPRNSAYICLVEHRSFSALAGGMSAAYFLYSSFLQAITAVMLWPVHVQKVPQASEHLRHAKLQTRCDIYNLLCLPLCQSICLFIPTDSGMPRTVDPQKSSMHGSVCASWGSPFQTPRSPSTEAIYYCY